MSKSRGSDLSHRELKSIDVEIKSLQSRKVVEIDATGCTVMSIMISDKIMKTSAAVMMTKNRYDYEDKTT